MFKLQRSGKGMLKVRLKGPIMNDEQEQEGKL